MRVVMRVRDGKFFARSSLASVDAVRPVSLKTSFSLINRFFISPPFMENMPGHEDPFKTDNI